MRCHYLFAIALLACAACADNGTSTGNPAPNDGGPDSRMPDEDTDGNGGLAEGGYCEAGDMTPLAIDEDSPLGFSAADILAFTEGVHEELIRWNPQMGLTFSPESGEQEVTITVTATGEPRFVEPKPPGSGSGAENNDLPLIDIDSNCVSWVEIDVDVTVESSGGALDESFEGVLRAHTPLSASIYSSIKPDEIGGDLEVEATAGGPYEGFELGGLQVAVRFSPYSVGGALNGWLQQINPDGDSVATGGGAPYATFGAGTCGDNADGFTVGDDDAIEGATLQDVLDFFNADDEVGITWENGDVTTSSFAFAPDTQGGCVLLDNETAGDLTLLTDGTLTMTSADGRLMGAWPGRIEGHVESGEVTRVHYLISGKLPSHTMPGANVLYGFPNDDISSFDAAGVNADITITSARIEGTVSLTGYVFQGCDETPPDQPADGDADPSEPGSIPPDMGGGSGGCRGADPVVVASGTVQ